MHFTLAAVLVAAVLTARALAGDGLEPTVPLCSASPFVASVSELNIDLPPSFDLSPITSASEYSLDFVLGPDSASWAIYVTTHEHGGRSVATYFFSSTHRSALVKLEGVHAWGPFRGLLEAAPLGDGAVILGTMSDMHLHRPWGAQADPHVQNISENLKNRWVITLGSAWLPGPGPAQHIALGVHRPTLPWPEPRRRLEPLVVDTAGGQIRVVRFKHKLPRMAGLTLQALGQSGDTTYLFYGKYDHSVYKIGSRSPTSDVGAVFGIPTDKFTPQRARPEDFTLVWADPPEGARGGRRSRPSLHLMPLSPSGHGSSAWTVETSELLRDEHGHYSPRDRLLHFWGPGFAARTRDACVIESPYVDAANLVHGAKSQLIFVKLEPDRRVVTGQILLLSANARADIFAPTLHSAEAALGVTGALGVVGAITALAAVI